MKWKEKNYRTKHFFLELRRKQTFWFSGTLYSVQNSVEIGRMMVVVLSPAMMGDDGVVPRTTLKNLENKNQIENHINKNKTTDS